MLKKRREITMPSSKKMIDQHIIQAVENHEIREQSILQNILKKLGYEIPQATLSRRMHKLKIAKISGVYKVIDLQLPNSPVVLNMQVSKLGLIILHTHPGNANSLAYFIDQKYVSRDPKHRVNSGILGTIAGDDTVLVITNGKKELAKAIKSLQKSFSYLKNITS